MKLAAACPFAKMTESQLAEGEIDLTDCCRAGAFGWLSGSEEPLCRSQTEQEAYRFFWDSSFHGHAVVHIGHSGASIALRWTYWCFGVSGASGMPVRMDLTPDAWEKLQQGLKVAKFWSLDRGSELPAGFDGAQRRIEGRRGQTYHAIGRWAPRGEVYDLGRVFFDLAGPPLAGIKFY